jgi:hypothetical protein
MVLLTVACAIVMFLSRSIPRWEVANDLALQVGSDAPSRLVTRVRFP